MFKRGPSGVRSTEISVFTPSAAVNCSRNSVTERVMSLVIIASGLPRRSLSLTSAHTLHATLRGRSNAPNVGRANQIVGQVLLADAPEVANTPVHGNSGARPSTNEV